MLAYRLMLTPSDRKLILHALSEEVPMFASLGEYEEAGEEINDLRAIAKSLRTNHAVYASIAKNHHEDADESVLDTVAYVELLADKLAEQCRDFEDEHKRHTGEEIE